MANTSNYLMLSCRTLHDLWHSGCGLVADKALTLPHALSATRPHPSVINHVKHSAPTLSNTYVKIKIIVNVHVLIYACQTHSVYILLTSQVGHSRGYSMCHLQLTLGIQTIHVTLQEPTHTHEHYIRTQLTRLCVRLVINTKLLTNTHT